MKEGFLYFIVACFFIGNADAALLVSGQYSIETWAKGYGNGWDQMTTAIDSAFNNNVDVTESLDDWNQLILYDSLWVDARSTDGFSFLLNQTEIDNINLFINHNRKVVLMGEHSGWSNWNQQIIGIAGGTYAGGNINGNTNSLNHPLTEGVTSVNIHSGGTVAVGGTPLFEDNFATLWGHNVLTVLDTDFWETPNWPIGDNAQFGENVAEWLGTPVPIPSAVWLLGLGLIGVIGIRRKIRNYM